MNRVFKIILSAILAISLCIIPVHASENTITGFKTYDVNSLALTYSVDDKPTLEELTSNMPGTLDVYVNNELETVNVTWQCVGDDYETSEDYYFQFSPVFDGYSIDEDLDVYADAPYISVFLSADSGISTLSINSGTKGTNEAKIFDYLTDTLGLNTAAACGILANMVSESAFMPNNLQNSYETKYSTTDAKYTAAVDNGTYKYSTYSKGKQSFIHDSAGYGLVQWTYYTRKEGLYDACKAAGTSIADMNTQLDFMNTELASYKVSNSDSCAINIPTSITKLLTYLKSLPDTATGAYNAAYAYCYFYEKPSSKTTKAVTRGNLAKNTYFAHYKDNVTTDPSTEEEIIIIDPPVPVLTNKQNYINISWDATDDAEGYYIYRKKSGDSSYTKIATTSSLNYKDTSVSFNKKYYYYIIAYQGTVQSGHTAKSITYLPNLTPTVTNTSSGVKLTWSKVTGCTGYYIYRKIGSGSYKKIKTITSNSTVSYTNKSLTSGKKYTYYVKAYKSKTYGKYTAKSTYWLSKVTGLKAKAVTSSTEVGCGTVYWTKVTGATGYEVWYQRSSSSSTSGAVDIEKTTTKNFSEMAVSSYRVKVRAYKLVGSTKYYGAYTSEITMKVKQ